MPILSPIGAACSAAFGLPKSAAGGAADPYFYDVTMLLTGNGTNGAQNNTFLDSSTNAFSITRNGNTTQGSFSPYGSLWSNSFNGTSTFGLSASSAYKLDSDFTIEGWVNSNPYTDNYQTVISIGNGYGGSNNIIIYFNRSDLQNKYKVTIDDVEIINGSITVAVGVWSHFALVRSGTSLKLYVNGALDTSTTKSGTVFSSNPIICIGAETTSSTNTRFNGYISNLRITNTVVYSTTFTPSTTPLTAVSGTQLLTCQSNRFIDNSSNASALTVNGTPSVQRFSPFNPTASYDTATIGGSGYFDGSGDYLSMTSGTSLGSGDFTIEGWVYFVTAPDSDSGNILSSYNYYTSGYNGNAVFRLGTSYGGRIFNGQTQVAQISGSFTWKTNTWYHFAWVRSGSTITLYQNGVSIGSMSASTNLSDFANGLVIGAARINGTASDFSNYYLSNLRIVVGTAVYTSTFTPPTTPVTAISGTSVLANMTNAGIPDSAMMNDLETVGNAQISTSVKKYGTGSLAFDGDGDYLKANQGVGFEGNFTVEMWVYITDAAKGNYFFSTKSSGNSGQYLTIRGNYSGGNQVLTMDFNGSSATGPNLSASTWYHIAVARTGSTMKLFLNGTQVNSLTSSTAVLCDSIAPIIGGTGYLSDMSGYIDDLRVTKGYARYWENFTPPAAALPNFGGAYQVPTQDPQFNYTTLLLPGNGTNGAQNNTFLDSSTNAFTITRNGNTTQGTFTPFSQTGWSNYFDGSGDALYIANTSNLELAASDYTWEFWVNPDAYSGPLFGKYASGNYSYYCEIQSGGTVYYIQNVTGNKAITSSAVLQKGQWTHVAIVRYGTTLTMYFNGTAVASSAVDANQTSSSTTGFGIGVYGSTYTTPVLTGYLSNFRFNQTTAIYTANFTPPTSPLTAVSGTKLLTCQANRFIDSSSVASTITINGNPSVQAFSPFAPTAAYSASTVGGSSYMNGVDTGGSYLQTPSNALLSQFTGDFSIEGWAYTDGVNTYNDFIQGATTGSPWWYIEISNAGAVNVSLGGGLGSLNGSGAYAKQWNHIVLCRSGSTVALFINGVRASTVTTSSTIGDTRAITIGSNYEEFGGYISGVRIVNGSSAYNASSSTLTVPTAPPTAITNTQLLLNMTNAGITDATAKNDLETVGNAQISTTQSKFGGSSMYFDGTGDWLKAPSSDLYSFGTGDFTIEAWVYPTTLSGTPGFLDTRAASGDSGYAWYFQGSALYLYTGGADRLSPTTSVSTNTWTHIALVRYGSTISQYINGSLDVSATYAGSMTCPGSLIAAGWYNASTPYTGYINDLRITKGYARYVQPFTPPAQAFQLY